VNRTTAADVATRAAAAFVESTAFDASIVARHGVGAPVTGGGSF
jgi:hypothetical protein